MKPIKIEANKKHWTMLVYGNAGVGKTVFCGNTKMKTLMIDVDNGLLSIRAVLGKAKQSTDHIDVLPVRNYRDFMEAWAYAKAHAGEYEVVVIDTLTELQRLVVDHLCETNNLPIPRIQDWGTVQKAMHKLSVDARYLATNIVFTSHEEVPRTESKDGVVEQYRPAFQGATSREIMRHYDLIGRFVLVKQKKRGADDKESTVTARVINFGPNVNAITKDRSDSLLEYEVPDLTAILKKVQSAVNILPEE